MGTVLKKKTTRAVPAGAEVVEKDGKPVARWRVRGKLRTAPVTTGADGRPRILTESRTYFAKYRDHNGEIVVRPTGCRDEQAARQRLAGWEREVERIKAGTLDARELDTARKGAEALEDHLDAYEGSLVAAEVSETYRENVLRAVRRIAADCGFVALADIDRESVERWLAERIRDDMSARTRNYYRESLVAFANWCRDSGRIADHDLDRLPKADQKADPRRRRRALTEDELKRILAVAALRPLTEARTVRRGKHKGLACAELTPENGVPAWKPSGGSGR